MQSGCVLKEREREKERGEEGSIGHFFKKICNNGRNVTWWPFEEEERVREALLG